MRRFANKVIWITGASSGIGRAAAIEFARENASLLLTARNAAQLANVRSECLNVGAPNVVNLPFDLSNLDELPALAEKAIAVFGHIDVFFNNAGVSQRGTAVETELSVIRRVMDLDYYAPVILTKTVLPKMIEQGGGQLAVTTSINGMFGFPMRCAYSSAKHALYGFFETIAAENYNDNIRVTIVTPGRVQTSISLNALEKDGRLHGKMDAGQANGISAEKAAVKIVKAIYKRKPEVLVGGVELAMVYIKRLFPRLCARIARSVEAM